ncbi:hypothetical protein [Pseudomonas sp. B15(2017)]
MQLVVDTYPGRQFHGKVSTIETLIDSVTRWVVC